MPKLASSPAYERVSISEKSKNSDSKERFALDPAERGRTMPPLMLIFDDRSLLLKTCLVALGISPEPDWSMRFNGNRIAPDLRRLDAAWHAGAT